MSYKRVSIPFQRGSKRFSYCNSYNFLGALSCHLSLIPKSDSNSPYSSITESNIKVMRIKKMITEALDC